MIEKTYSFIKDGKENSVYTLINKNGYKVEILTYGARIIRIWMPDRFGALDDIIVGYAKPEDYYNKNNSYFGATVGRYANRIGNSEFTLNGTRYLLENNDGKNCLHGGSTENFDRKIWDADVRGDSLVMSLISKDGAGGFPGELKVKVSFNLTNENELKIEYFAVSDKDTVCNLINHSYFNLGCGDTVLDQELYINSHKITKVDKELIPHGEYQEIDGTPYSFKPSKAIGQDINSDEEMIALCGGYDVNYCIDRKTEHDLELCASVYDKRSGRKMECFTTLPGLQLYTGNGLEGVIGKKRYKNHCALCLETQFYPNSPNCREYPSAVLKAGKKYKETTIYKFSVE